VRVIFTPLAECHIDSLKAYSTAGGTSRRSCAMRSENAKSVLKSSSRRIQNTPIFGTSDRPGF
jgi:hypothetical protein